MPPSDFISMNGLMVFLGGGIGSLLRWWASSLIAQRAGESFPWGTLFVNVTGSFVIGFLAALASAGGRWDAAASQSFRMFFMLGICGGYTTFSSWSLQTLDLARNGEWWKVGVNILLSTTLCLAAVWLGYLSSASISPLFVEPQSSPSAISVKLPE